MNELKNIFDIYIERGDNGDYIPDDAPTEAKNAFKEWCDLLEKQRDEEMADWWN